MKEVGRSRPRGKGERLAVSAEVLVPAVVRLLRSAPLRLPQDERLISEFMDRKKRLSRKGLESKDFSLKALLLALVCRSDDRYRTTKDLSYSRASASMNKG